MHTSFIQQHLEKGIREAYDYVSQTSLRQSLEDYRNYWLEQTETLKTFDASAALHNLETIDQIYADFKETLEEQENEFTPPLQRLIQHFEEIDSNRQRKLFSDQLKTIFTDFVIKDSHAQGFAFVFDSEPYFSITAYPKQTFPFILETPQYIDWEIPEHSGLSDHQLDFSEIAAPFFDDGFQDVAWEFDFELPYFHQMKNLFLYQTYLLLHEALQDPKIIQLLIDLPVAIPTYFYAAEHDSEYLSIFVLKGEHP
jgi:hypothetical protein